MDTVLNNEDLKSDTNKTKGIPGSTLKIIAIVAMLIDHTAAIVLDDFLAGHYPVSYTAENVALFYQQYGAIYYLDMFMRCIGRFGFPIFCFLLIEGFMHTHDIKKYIRNLFIFALVSEIPFNLGFDSTLFNPDYQNVFFTLLIGVLTLTGIKYVGEEKKWSEKLTPLFYLASLCLGALLGYELHNGELGSFIVGFTQTDLGFVFFMIVGAIVGLAVMLINFNKWDADKKNAFTFGVIFVIAGTLIADLLKTDYSGWGVLTIVVMYLFRNNYKKRIGWGVFTLCFCSLLEVWAFLMLIPVARYNGKRGLSLKYFFYAFYPVHILLLYLIALALGFTTFAIK